MHVSEVSPGLPSPVGVVDEYGAVGDRAVPSDLQAVDVAQVDGEVDEEASLDICCKSVSRNYFSDCTFNFILICFVFIGHTKRLFKLFQIQIL